MMNIEHMLYVTAAIAAVFVISLFLFWIKILELNKKVELLIQKSSEKEEQDKKNNGDIKTLFEIINKSKLIQKI